MSEALSIHHDQAGHQFENQCGRSSCLPDHGPREADPDIYRTFVPNALWGEASRLR